MKRFLGKRSIRNTRFFVVRHIVTNELEQAVADANQSVQLVLPLLQFGDRIVRCSIVKIRAGFREAESFTRPCNKRIHEGRTAAIHASVLVGVTGIDLDKIAERQGDTACSLRQRVNPLQQLIEMVVFGAHAWSRER